MNNNELLENLTRKVMTEIKKRLRETLNEELGINDKVKDAVLDALDVVKSNFDKFKRGESVDAKINFNGKTVNFTFTRNDDAKADGNVMYLEKGGPSFVSCDIPMINGQIRYAEVADSIQHELNHVFQQDKLGYKRYAYDKAYATALTNIWKPEKAKNILARIVYLSDPHEQDSIINGLYAHIMYCLSQNTMPDKSKTDAFIQLANLKSCREYVTNPKNSKEIDRALMEYDGITTEVDKPIQK